MGARGFHLTAGHGARLRAAYRKGHRALGGSSPSRARRRSRRRGGHAACRVSHDTVFVCGGGVTWAWLPEDVDRPREEDVDSCYVLTRTDETAWRCEAACCRMPHACGGHAACVGVVGDDVGVVVFGGRAYDNTADAHAGRDDGACSRSSMMDPGPGDSGHRVNTPHLFRRRHGPARAEPQCVVHDAAADSASLLEAQRVQDRHGAVRRRVARLGAAAQPAEPARRRRRVVVDRFQLGGARLGDALLERRQRPLFKVRLRPRDRLRRGAHGVQSAAASSAAAAAADHGPGA